MNAIKNFFKRARTRVWFIVTVSVAALMTVVSILGTTTFSTLFKTLFGGEEVLGKDRDIVYYPTEAKSKEEAYSMGNALNEELCEEGFVLLKNKDGALPLDVSEIKNISVFGKNSVNLVYGGSGSGAGKTTGAATIYDSLESAGFECNPSLKSFYESGLSGEGRPDNPSIENGGITSLSTGETPYSAYTQSVMDSYKNYGDAAIIVISRMGGEGFDLPRYSSSSHYLQLDDNERELILNVEAQFEKVIVVLNTNNIMEIGEMEDDDGISAIIHMAGPGYSGVNALGRLLSGEKTFSAHTVDTWQRDFTKDPTWYNFGNNLVNGSSSSAYGNEYVTQDGAKSGYFFVDYEESIYVGYRYYETRGFTDGEEWYDENVVYPFGYGLSYTTFEWEVTEAEIEGKTLGAADKDTEFSIKVNVKNTGNYSGKDVVELYASAPYYEGGIEKASVVLCGYEKTPLLAPGEESTVEITFNPYSIASYDCYDSNNNGFSGYELDGGEYILSLRSDAHTAKDSVESIDFSVTDTGINYPTDSETGAVVENRFDDADDEIYSGGTALSRTDWEGTFPEMKNTRTLGDYVTAEKLRDVSTNNPEEYNSVPTTGKSTSLKLIDMRGLEYNDVRWDELLDGLSFENLKDLYNNGAFRTVSIDEIGKPATLESDGPVGFTNFMSDAEIYGTVSYCGEVVMGSTWNTELVREMGERVGEEGVFGKQGARSWTPYSGWYAPGMNIHRSPFGGRNYEYFSEDSYLTGTLAAAEINGVNSKGVYTFMKHFALNEQETDRDSNGIATWATEQSMRELYLKPFEIAVKSSENKALTGVMTSFNRIGTRWTGGDYRLITEVLRGEWGFKGSVICDFNVSGYMNTKQMIYAGGDLNLTTTRPWMSARETSAGDVTVLRNAAHHVLYTVVNSCAMNGIDGNTHLYTGKPLYVTWIIVADCALAGILVAWGIFAVLSSRKKSE